MCAGLKSPAHWLTAHMDSITILSIFSGANVSLAGGIDKYDLTISPIKKTNCCPSPSIHSGVFYTKMPESIEKERKAEDHYPSVGDILFMCGDPKTFSGHKLQHPPEVGDIFLFPSWLTHMVYPFRTPNEERRSVSFNLRLVPKGATLTTDEHK